MNEVDKLEYEKHLDLFAKEVCSICNICRNPIAPETCRLFWEAGGDAFLNTVVIKAQYIKQCYKEKFDKLNTFEGFVTLFCNASICPMYNMQCVGDIKVPISCYKYFLLQSNIVLTETKEAQIYKNCVGKSIVTIKENFGLPIDFPKTAVLMMKKKKRKKLIKSIRKAGNNLNAVIESSIFFRPERNNVSRYDMSISGKKKQKTTKRTSVMKKEPTTLLFYNEDEEWLAQVNKYLTN